MTRFPITRPVSAAVKQVIPPIGSIITCKFGIDGEWEVATHEPSTLGLKIGVRVAGSKGTDLDTITRIPVVYLDKIVKEAPILEIPDEERVTQTI